MSEVAARRTPWVDRELLADYDAAWRAVIGPPLSRFGLALLHSQATLECGRGGTSCWNHNSGNIMLGSWAGDYHVLRGAPECYDANHIPFGATVLKTTNIACGPGKIAAIPPGGSKFRAYPTLLEGCTDKIRMLDKRWPRAIVALAAAVGPGDADAFVAGLVGPPRYFTASSLSYANMLRSLSTELLRKMTDSAWPPLPAPPRHALDVQPVEVTQAADFVPTLSTDEEPKA